MAKKKKTITVEGSEISLLPIKGKEDYISLTDIMKKFDDEYSIYSWMRNSNTVIPLHDRSEHGMAIGIGIVIFPSLLVRPPYFLHKPIVHLLKLRSNCN
jgi:hypothetical protein